MGTAHLAAWLYTKYCSIDSFFAPSSATDSGHSLVGGSVEARMREKQHYDCALQVVARKGHGSWGPRCFLHGWLCGEVWLQEGICAVVATQAHVGWMLDLKRNC